MGVKTLAYASVCGLKSLNRLTTAAACVAADFLLLRGKKNNKITGIREVIDRNRLTDSLSRYKGQTGGI